MGPRDLIFRRATDTGNPVAFLVDKEWGG